MRAILPIVLLLGPAIHAEDAPEPPPRKTPAVSLLPDGSQLHRVMLPRYDEERRLSAVLKADLMTLVSRDVIAGENVAIEFFNADRSRGGNMEMKSATFDQSNGLLETGDPVRLESGRILVDGTGLIYRHDQGKGFLTGPATTLIRALTETTMKKPHPFQRPAVGVVGAALLGIATAGPPAALTGKEIAGIEADAEPAAPRLQENARAARADLRAQLEATARTTAEALAFLDEAGLADGESGAPVHEPPAAPLEVELGPEDTLISCEGGVYFDADTGELLYLKNVRVKDPLFDLRGANQLTIHLAKKPEEPVKPEDGKPAEAEEKAAPGMGIGANFGNVDRIVATGAVHIRQKQPEAGKEPIEAAGAIFTYWPESGKIVITGGYPWVKQGTTYFRATQPELNLNIWKDGSFKTEGPWEMGGRLNQGR